MGAGVLDPVEKGRIAYASMAPDAPMTPLFVMHGQSDLVVAPINGVQLVQQWTTCADLHWDGLENDDVSATAPQTLTAGDENTRDARLQKHALPSGQLMVASLWVDGLGHKWPGSMSGNPYADAVGPSATQWMWDFFTDNLP
jgi:poly(3-hydroxybutyrate) depolymerase